MRGRDARREGGGSVRVGRERGGVLRFSDGGKGVKKAIERLLFPGKADETQTLYWSPYTVS